MRIPRKITRTTLLKALKTCQEKISSLEFLNLARKRPQDFTRKRKMPFVQLVMFMINMLRSSTQTCLDGFFEMTGQEEIHMTQQSFSEARQKMNWEACRELHLTSTNVTYEGYYETWHGYRLSAMAVKYNFQMIRF